MDKQQAIRMRFEIAQAPTGRGNEFGAGVRVATSPFGAVPECVGATWLGICMAVNDYMRSRGTIDFDCTKSACAPQGLDVRTPIELAHDSALRAIEALARTNPAVNTPEGELLSGLAAAVEAYEKHRYPFPSGTRPT